MHTFKSTSKTIATAIIFFAGLTACQTEKKSTLTITNPAGIDRTDARIIVSRDKLSNHYPDLTDKFFLINDESGNSIPYQLDDLDGDGQWDELALLYSLGSMQAETFTLVKSDSAKRSSFKNRTQIWFARQDSGRNKYHYKKITHEIRPEGYHRIMKTPFYYQYEGPGWENDKIGFRLYFDERNGFDIWGKTTNKMILQEVGLKGDNYHSLSPWGMDVLHVGNTLGAGGIAFVKEDSLYHLGFTDKAEFQEITDGPVRAIFDITYKGWHIDDKAYSLRERISIWGGQYGYENEVSLLNDDTEMTLAAGIVTAKLPGKPNFKTNGQPFPYVVGWGRQSEHDDNLGMAVVGTSAAFTGYGQSQNHSGSVDSSAYITYRLKPNHPVKYEFVAGWEVSNKGFGKKDYFTKTVQNEGERLSNPVKISFN